jgi:hypothetical protein
MTKGTRINCSLIFNPIEPPRIDLEKLAFEKCVPILGHTGEGM